MSELVEKLRAQAGISGYHSLMVPAADEIERLSCENERLEVRRAGMEEEYVLLTKEYEILLCEGERKSVIIEAAQHLYWNHAASEGGMVDPGSELWTKLRDALFPVSEGPAPEPPYDQPDMSKCSRCGAEYYIEHSCALLAQR